MPTKVNISASKLAVIPRMFVTHFMSVSFSGIHFIRISYRLCKQHTEQFKNDEQQRMRMLVALKTSSNRLCMRIYGYSKIHSHENLSVTNMRCTFIGRLFNVQITHTFQKCLANYFKFSWKLSTCKWMVKCNQFRYK